MIVAKYKCPKEHQWQEEIALKSGGQNAGPCPVCGSIYFQWVNYYDLFPDKKGNQK